MQDNQNLSIPDSWEQDLPEQSYNSEEVEHLAKTSLDFLAALSMPRIFRYFYPPVFQSIWQWLLSYVHLERDFSQLAVGLPRGFAKTTFAKLFLLYVILFTKRKFILVCANTAPKAWAILADLIDFLEEPNIRSTFGDWKLGVEIDRQDLKKFGFRGRTIIIAAATVDTVRGLNIKNERPDVMLFDDIQSLNDAESEAISKQIERDLYGTAMKAKSPHGCLYIFLGNIYATKWSLLRKIKHDPTWIKFITGAIQADGTSIWEELQPVSQLLKEYERDLNAGLPHIFLAEVLNDETASAHNVVDITKIPLYDIPEDSIHQGNFIIIDPATDKAKADAVSIGYFEVHGEQIPIKEVEEGRFSPMQTIEHALAIALRRRCSVIAIESNAYQYSLLYWFDFICAQRGISGIRAVEVYSGRYSKNSRILQMFKTLLDGSVAVHPSCRPKVNAQIAAFNPHKTDNTDGLLDLLTYAPKVKELYSSEILATVEVELQENAAIQVWEAHENSPF